MYEKIKQWYNLGLWTKEMVKNAVKKGIITDKQCCQIVSE